MKRLTMLLIAIFLLCATVRVNAQYEFKPFRVDLGLGIAIPTAKSVGVGIPLILEPKYALPSLPQLSVGLKLELDNILRAAQNKSETKIAGQWQVIVSYLATGDYHLTQNTFRPFVGAGFGIYKIGALSVTASTEDPNRTTGEFRGDAVTNFGALIRCGFDVSHFRLALSYNIAGKDGIEFKSNFVSLTIGAYFGGGKKK